MSDWSGLRSEPAFTVPISNNPIAAAKAAAISVGGLEGASMLDSSSKRRASWMASMIFTADFFRWRCSTIARIV